MAFVKRFVLASGSLEEPASIYGISYPTVRLRLDRLIQKVTLLEREEPAPPFERLLRMQHADGKIDRETLKVLLEAHCPLPLALRCAWTTRGTHSSS